MGRLIAVDTAMLCCDKGSAPVPLKATNKTAKFGGFWPANILDHVPGTNISPFGRCGVLNSSCSPNTPSPWIPPFPTVRLVQPVPVLAFGSTLACNSGGIIQILDPGQYKIMVDNQRFPGNMCGPPPPGKAKGNASNSACGAAASACGAAASGASACGAAASACGAAAAGASACGAAASACGVAVDGASACGAAASACGAAASGVSACGVAATACGAAASGASACGANVGACGAQATGASACAANLPCSADACGADACGVDATIFDLCSADVCAVDIIPIIPFI